MLNHLLFALRSCMAHGQFKMLTMADLSLEICVNFLNNGPSVSSRIK